MTRRLTIPDPRAFAGLALLSFAAFVVLDGLQIRSIPEVTLGFGFAGCGWLLRRRGNAHVVDNRAHATAKKWLRFAAITVPVVIAAYILGYFVLMDNHRPTDPLNKGAKFESSFRWAPFEPTATKGGTANTLSPFPQVTIWNSIYQPIDRLYFRAYPRTDEEIEKLRAIGYRW